MKIRTWAAMTALAGGMAMDVIARANEAPADETPLTREQILKDGPVALEKNCLGCHLADKWEGTSRDRDGWAAIVGEMSKQMTDAKMPKMSEKTFNLIVDYLTLTHPQ